MQSSVWEGVEFVRADATKMPKGVFTERTADFLIYHGLPVAYNVLTFSLLKEGPLPVHSYIADVNQLSEDVSADCTGLFVIGEFWVPGVSPYIQPRYVCINTYAEDCVLFLPLGTYEWTFMNTGVTEFFQFLTIHLREFKPCPYDDERCIGFYEPIAAAMREAMLGADPVALSGDEYFWPPILEAIEDTGSW